MDILLICSVHIRRTELCPSVVLLKPTILQTSLSLNLTQIYELLRQKQQSLSEVSVIKEVTLGGPNEEHATVSGDDLSNLTFSDYRSLANYTTVTFLASRGALAEVIDETHNSSICANSTVSSRREEIPETRNAFDVLMSSASKQRRMTDLVFISEDAVTFRGGNGEKDAKYVLARDVLAHLCSCDVKVYKRSVDRAGVVIRELCNLLWKLDGQLDKLESRKKMPAAARRFCKYIGNTVNACVYRNWITQKKPAPRLRVEDMSTCLHSLQSSLHSLLATSFTPGKGERSRKTESFFSSVASLVEFGTCYLDHMSDTSVRTVTLRSNEKRQFRDHGISITDATTHSDLPAVSSGVIEACQGQSAKLHSMVEPLIKTLSSAPFYTITKLDFDRHAITGHNLHSVEKQGINFKKYAASASIRHSRQRTRDHIIRNGLPFPVGFYREAVAGRTGTVMILWPVPVSPEQRSSSRQAAAVLNASRSVKKVLSREKSLLYSRTIVEIGQSKGTLKSGSATALLELFGFTPSSRGTIDESRIACALTSILGGNPYDNLDSDGYVTTLANDLRTHSCQKRGPKLSKFFEAAADFLDHSVSSTGAKVDQRRAVSSTGGAKMYMPIAMSLTDLRNRIRHHAEQHLNLKLGTDFDLPSQEWLRLQFHPPRHDTLTAAKFSGLLGLHRAVQSRTIRQNHEDCHFVRALWKYIRYWCHPLATAGHAIIVSVDDKCGVKIGEPGMPIGALQRRRKDSICASSDSAPNTGPLAADHDYSVVTLTPSVTLFITPPCDRSGPFSRGTPYLTLKNAVFESSNPLRHAAELVRSIRHRYQGKTIPPVLVVFSDGGGDHRTNLYSVQLSFLYVMVELDLDEVVCVRTAPGDSWINTAERRMADLNIAWEAASFSRMSAIEAQGISKDHAKWFDKHIKSAGSMAEIRKLVDHEDVKTNHIDVPGILSATVRPVVMCMRDAVERFQCEANEGWVVMDPAEEKEMQAVMSFLKSEVCSTLEKGKLQAASVEGTMAEKILKCHIIESSRYCFQLRKRLSSTAPGACLPHCPLCPMTTRLPPKIFNQLHPIPFPVLGDEGSYTPFDDLYGKDNSEVPPIGSRRSLAPRAIKLAMSGTTCRGLIQCVNCKKKRSVYSRTKAAYQTSVQLIEISRDEMSFVCGSPTIFSDTLERSNPSALLAHPGARASNARDPKIALLAIKKCVYIQTEICCDDPIEESVFTSPYITDSSKNICCFCGGGGVLKRDSRRNNADDTITGSSKVQVSRPYCTDCRKDNLPRYPKTRKRTKKASGNIGGTSRVPKRQRNSRDDTEGTGNISVPIQQNLLTRTQNDATESHGGRLQAPLAERGQGMDGAEVRACDVGYAEGGNAHSGSNPVAPAAISLQHMIGLQNNGANEMRFTVRNDMLNNPRTALGVQEKQLVSQTYLPNTTLPNSSCPTVNPGALYQQQSFTPFYHNTEGAPHQNSFNASVTKSLTENRVLHSAGAPAGPSLLPIPIAQTTSTSAVTTATYCSAGPQNCVFYLRGESRSPAHLCKNKHCPRRNLGLHNMCNFTQKRPELLPPSLAFEGPELTFFCSEHCIASYTSDSWCTGLAAVINSGLEPE